MAPKKNDITITKESKTKESKTKEPKTKEPEIKEPEIKEPEIIESEESEGEESEESEGEESEGEESESEESEDAKKSVKEKKVKKTWQENINEITQLTTDLKKNENEYKLLQDNLHKIEKTRSYIIKQLSRINPFLIRSMEDGIKFGSKKPKRKGNSSSGFNKEGPVPPKLIKYLELDNEIQMSRPKVVHLLYTKFKNDNLTTGQNIIFDKNTAKFFGKDKDYELNFKQIQTFLKEIYDEAFPKS
jgi:protein phosphatase 1E